MSKTTISDALVLVPLPAVHTTTVIEGVTYVLMEPAILRKALSACSSAGAVKAEPVAWQHCLVNLDGYEYDGEVTTSEKHPFGRPGRDYDASFSVVSRPLYTHPTPQEAAGVRGPCIPVTYCGLATSTHVPVGSDEDHCDLCGHPAQPYTHPTISAERVTDEAIAAVATLYGNYIPGHGWTGFGPTPAAILAALTEAE